MYQFFHPLPSSSSSYALGPLGLRKEGRVCVCVCVTETALLNLFTLEQLSLSLLPSFLLSLSSLSINFFLLKKEEKGTRERTRRTRTEHPPLFFPLFFPLLFPLFFLLTLSSFLLSCPSNRQHTRVCVFIPKGYIILSSFLSLGIELCFNQESNQKEFSRIKKNFQESKKETIFFLCDTQIDPQREGNDS